MVISVIVIIAAVIAAFASGMVTGVTRTVVIAVSAHQQDANIVRILEGSRDVPSLHALTVTGTEADGTAITGSFANTPPNVGDTLRISNAGKPGSDHVVVVAELVDGSKQVVLDVVV